MTTTTGRWLLVALAVVGLAIATPVVGAHGGELTLADDRTAGPTAHVAGHAGPGGVEMGAHAGATVDEMAHGVVGGDHHHDGALHDPGDGHEEHGHHDEHDEHGEHDEHAGQHGTHGGGDGC